MAADIYKPSGKNLSGGWAYQYTKSGGDNMRMGVYSRVKADGTTEYSLVNKGTTINSTNDWKNNGQQLFGSSNDMKASIANAVATGTNCIVFNPATVNLSAYGLSSSNYNANMTAFIVKGDVLNNAEGWFSSPIDKAVYLPQQYGGHWYQGWQTNVVDKVRNHMMDAVINALQEAGYN